MIFTKMSCGRKSTKGFTLVEIIVVLVILAILAAAVIPSMLGFVSDAKQKSLTNEVRAVYNAIQAYTTECFAKGKPDGIIMGKINGDLTPEHSLYYLLGNDATGTISSPTIKNGKVNYFMYTKNNVRAGLYEGSKIEFVKTNSTSDTNKSDEVRTVYSAAQIYAAEHFENGDSDDVIADEINGTLNPEHNLYQLLQDNNASGTISNTVVQNGQVEYFNYVMDNIQAVCRKGTEISFQESEITPTPSSDMSELDAEVEAVRSAAQTYATERFNNGDSDELIENNINGVLNSEHSLYYLLQGTATGTIFNTKVENGVVKSFRYTKDNVISDEPFQSDFTSPSGPHGPIQPVEP